MPRHSSTKISVTTDLSSPTKISIEQSLRTEEYSTNKSFLNGCMRFVAVQSSKKCFYSFRSKLRVEFFSSYKFDIVHQNPSRKPNTCGRSIRVKSRRFCHLQENHANANTSRKKFFSSNFARDSNSYFSITTGFISFIRFSIRNFPWEELFNVKIIRFVSCFRIRMVKNYKNAIYKNLSRYSNS